MSRFYHLSKIEVNVLELIVELAGHLLEERAADVLIRRLNEAANEAIRQKWRMIHPDPDDLPVMHFKIESLPDFDLNSVGLGLGPFQTAIGARVYITGAPSWLVS